MVAFNGLSLHNCLSSISRALLNTSSAEFVRAGLVIVEPHLIKLHNGGATVLRGRYNSGNDYWLRFGFNGRDINGRDFPSATSSATLQSHLHLPHHTAYFGDIGCIVLGNIYGIIVAGDC